MSFIFSGWDTEALSVEVDACSRVAAVGILDAV